MTPADAYFAMAKAAVAMAQSAKDLRLWWGSEARRRDDYRLSDDQLSHLIRLCKERVEELGEDEEDDRPQKTRPPRRRKRAAI